MDEGILCPPIFCAVFDWDESHSMATKNRVQFCSHVASWMQDFEPRGLGKAQYSDPKRLTPNIQGRVPQSRLTTYLIGEDSLAMRTKK